MEAASLITRAIEEYKDDVITGKFPGPEHIFSIKEEELKKINPSTPRPKTGGFAQD